MIADEQTGLLLNTVHRSPDHANRIRRDQRHPAWGRSYRLILVAGDFLAIGLAVTLSMLLASPIDGDVAGLTGVPYSIAASALGLIWLISLGAGGSRLAWITGAGVEEYRRVIKISLYVFGGVAIVAYILKAQFARSLFVMLLPIGALALLFTRWVTRGWLNHMRARGKYLTTCAIVGPRDQAARVISDLRHHKDAGFSPTGACILGDSQPDTSDVLDGVPVYTPRRLLESFDEFEAVVATEGLPSGYLRTLAWNLEGSSTSLVVTPRVMDIVGPRMHYTDAPGVSMMHVEIPKFSGWKYAIKRVFDIVFSILALILLSPVFLVTALLIKKEDGGPVIFRQQRVGRFGEPFTIHKFRSMSIDAESKIQKLIDDAGGQALFFKLDHDPRMTRIGAALRRFSIDELPQFWTVLKGDMSIVGPRPQMAREVAEYLPAYKRRLLAKPGITGLWQVCGRSDLSPEDGMRLDLRYVENWSPITDLTIVAKTVTTVFKSSGAY